MARHLLLVITDPVPGQEDEYNRWYSEQHLDDILRIPGFVAAQRFKMKKNATPALSGRYLAIYEMETDDPKATFAALDGALKSGQLVMSAAIDDANSITSFCTPITERKVRKTD